MSAGAHPETMSDGPGMMGHAAGGRGGPLRRLEAAVDSPWTRRWAPWLLGLLSLVLCLTAFTPLPHHGGDNAAYVALGQSLLDGQYVELWDTDTPPHTRYPPVMPALMAGAQALGLHPWIPLKLLVLLFAPLAVMLTYLWIARWKGHAFALTVAFLAAWSPVVVGYSQWVMSDIPFWAFLMLALYGFQRYGEALDAGTAAGGVTGAGVETVTGRDHETVPWHGFGIALGATLLALATRPAALPLFVAGAAWLAWKRRWHDLVVFVAIIGGLAFLFWLRANALGGGDYLAATQTESRFVPHLGSDVERLGALDYLRRTVDNTWLYVSEYLPLLMYGDRAPVLLPASIGVVVLSVVGWWRRVRRPTVDAFLVPLYMGMLLIWRTVDPRLLMPIYAILLVYAGDAFLAAVRAVRPAATRIAAVAAVALILGAGAYPQFYQLRRGVWCNLEYVRGDRYRCAPSERWRDYFVMLDRLGAVLPPDARVVSRKPTLTYVIAGYKGQFIPLSTDPEALFRLAEETGVRYLLLGREDPITDRYLEPAMRRRPDAFCVLDSLGPDRARVLGILPEAERGPGGEVPAGEWPEGSAWPELPPCPEGFR